MMRSGLLRGVRIGAYEVLEMLGRGAYGDVARARAPDGKIVALKVLHRTDAHASGRFARERRLLDGLGEEQGFVPLLDSGESPHGPFIAMPFVEGGTLADVLAKGPLAVAETRRLGIALARSLGEAHARGVIHRDLKPENILIRADGRPLIADLGLAKHFDRSGPGAAQSHALTRTGSIQGTPGYMAPEQMMDSRSAEPPADVFALGVILYECLTGQVPFPAPSLVDLVVNLEKGRMVPVRTRRPEVPRSLARIIERCLRYDPDDRFEDGAALAAELEKVRSGTRWVLAGLGSVLVIGTAIIFVLRPGATPSLEAKTATSPTTTGPADAKQLAADAATKAAAARAQARSLASNALIKARKDPVAALADATRATELDPDCALAWLARARARYERAIGMAPLPGADEGDVMSIAREARKEVERAVELDRQLAGAYGLRAMLGAWIGYGTGGIEAATSASVYEDAERALQLDPAEPLALLMRGERAIMNNDLKAALADTDAAIAADPESTRALMQRAGIFKRQGREDLSVDALARVIEINPRDVLAIGMRAQTLLGIGRYEEALKDAEAGMALNDKLAVCWFVRGAVRGMKDPRTGIPDVTRAMELDSKVAFFPYSRARFRDEIGELDGAIEDCSTAIVLSHEGRELPEARDYRATLLVKKGDNAGAIADLRALLRLTRPGTNQSNRLLARIDKLEKADSK